MNKITIQHIINFKKKNIKFATITAYDFTSAQIVDKSNIPLILVGDSASMMVFGYSTTLPVNMEEMLFTIKAVARGTKNALVVADMPFLSYQSSIEEAISNAGRMLKEGNAGAVKLEGGVQIQKHISSLVESGIPVLGHIGLTPQSINQMSGYKIQGKTHDDAKKIIKDAVAVQNAGAFGVVLECIPDALALEITNQLDIPTIGIGSGNVCDGQIQVYHDILGLSLNNPPKHAMQYKTLHKEILDALVQYKKDVEKF